MKCEVCSDNNAETKTRDEHWICMKCYDQCAEEFRTSIVMLNDAITARKTIMEHTRIINYVFTALAQKAQTLKAPFEKVYNELLLCEREYSEAVFKKGLFTTSKNERIEALKQCVQTLGLKVSLYDPVSEQLSEAVRDNKAKYIRNCLQGLDKERWPTKVLVLK